MNIIHALDDLDYDHVDKAVQNYHVAESTQDWLGHLSTITDVADASFDFDATVALRRVFDGAITDFNGLYNEVPFIATSKSTDTLEAFIGELIQDHYHDTKLLYAVYRFTDPMWINDSPIQYLIRYAVIPVDRFSKPGETGSSDQGVSV